MDNLFEFPHLTEALAAYGDYVVEKYRENLVEGGHKASGKLMSSLHTVVNVGDHSMSVDLYLEDYYKYLERERLKGSLPPVNKILEWIRIKPILPKPDSRGKLPTEEQLAWAISKNMEKIGAPSKDGLPVEPDKPLTNALESAEINYLGNIERAIELDLEEHLTSIMEILIV